MTTVLVASPSIRNQRVSSLSDASTAPATASANQTSGSSLGTHSYTMEGDSSPAWRASISVPKSRRFWPTTRLDLPGSR